MSVDNAPDVGLALARHLHETFSYRSQFPRLGAPGHPPEPPEVVWYKAGPRAMVDYMIALLMQQTDFAHAAEFGVRAPDNP
jgi:hypothetical protein